jgi:hypothetical protein
MKLHAMDNVAVALVRLNAGERVEADMDAPTVIRDPIPPGHKFALMPVAAGEPVVKYGEVIGILTSGVGPGDHVHVHNLVSARLPGPDGGR